ncbi:MAG: hypothetical protein O9284_04290 [Steroidobacteraceae bacterium]|nr:hypothetical protein [Steroidobacteraceae bacterium]
MEVAAHQPPRVAAAVDPLVVLLHDLGDRERRPQQRERVVAVLRMAAHDHALLVGQRPLLVQDLPRHLQLAEVVDARREVEHGEADRRELEQTTDRDRNARDPALVRPGARVAARGEAAQSLHARAQLAESRQVGIDGGHRGSRHGRYAAPPGRAGSVRPVRSGARARE